MKLRACRTCLSKYDLCPLFDSEFNSDQLFLATGVLITQEDGLPQTACKSCKKTIRESLHLRELSSKADQFFKTFAEHYDIKTEQNHVNIEHMTDNIIDPISKINDHNYHHCISQNEQINDVNKSHEANEEYGKDESFSNEDTKPIVENNELNDVVKDDFDSDDQHLNETEFVNIETKLEYEYEKDKKNQSRNCLKLSKDAQIMLYPTKNVLKNSMSTITKECLENLHQMPAIVFCQSLEANKPAKVTITTNEQYGIKCNANNIYKYKSNKLEEKTDDALGQPAKVSDQLDIVSGQLDKVTGQLDKVSTLKSPVSCQMSSAPDQILPMNIEEFVSSKELNDLFIDAYKFGNKLNSQRAKISGLTANISDETAIVSGQTSNVCNKEIGRSNQIENRKSKDSKSEKEFNKRLKNCKQFKCDNMTSIRKIKVTDSAHPKILEDFKIPADQDHENLFAKLMANLKEKLSKYVPKDTQECNVIKQKSNIIKPIKMDLNRRKHFQEKNKKLMSLAITPYNDDGPIECNICHDVTQNKRNFRNHALKHFEKQHICQFAGCGKKFVHRGQLSRHQQCMHGVEKRFYCAECGFRAADRPTMKNHIRAEHTGEKPYECNECGARFRMRNNIIQHISQVHFRPNKNLQCEYCPSRFQCRRDLWMHQDKIHFYNYTYYCYLCPNVYKSVCSARKHILKVHGVSKEQQLKLRRDKIRKLDAPNSSNLKPIVSNTPR